MLSTRFLLFVRGDSVLYLPWPTVAALPVAVVTLGILFGTGRFDVARYLPLPEVITWWRARRVARTLDARWRS